MTIALGVLLPAMMASGTSVNDTDVEEPIWKTWTVVTRGQSYPIQYSITSGSSIVNMVPDVETLTLTITISSTADGKLTIELPRELIDSREGPNQTGADNEFAVFVDDENVALDEIEATNTTRTLVIDFRRGTETIEIVATWLPMYQPPPLNEWQTTNIVGRFLYSDPPKPDQIFKVQYRVVNGTIEKLSIWQTKVSSNGNGTLEIKFPRNYPYTNQDGINVPITVNPILIVDGQWGDEITYSDITDCFFVFSIPFTDSKSIGLVWSYLATNLPFHGDDVPESCISQTLVENVPTRSDGTISPLKQFKAGVAAEDVVCRQLEGVERKFMLLISPYGEPYCVSLSNEGFMKAKGWTEPLRH